MFSWFNFSIETKVKSLFLLSYFKLSKKRNGILGSRILLPVAAYYTFARVFSSLCYMRNNVGLETGLHGINRPCKYSSRHPRCSLKN